MLGFLIAIAAGYATPHIEGPVAGPVIKFLDDKIAIAPQEQRAIAFMITLLAAAILSALLDSGSIFGLLIGAILGYFGQRIFKKITKIIDGQSDTE